MRDERIENYFNFGLTVPEIALFLASVHGMGISWKEYSDGWSVQATSFPGLFPWRWEVRENTDSFSAILNMQTSLIYYTQDFRV